MSVDSQVAKSDGMVVQAKSIDFSTQKMFRHPSYRYMPQYPNTFGQPIVIGSSQMPSTINLPPEVFNLSESYLIFTLNLPAVANRYIWWYADVIGCLGQLQHYCNTNQYQVNIDNVNKYMKAIKKEMSLSEFLTMDPTNGIYPSNTLANAVPALRHSASIGADPAPSFSNYIESAYFKVGALGTAVNINYCVPLKIFKNSQLSVDKNIYYGITSYLRIYWDVINRICYQSDSNASPSAGTKADYTGAATITNLQLMLAMESNTKLIEEEKARHLSGLSYFIPYVQSYKNPNSGGTQSISLQFDVGTGSTLAKILHQVYNNEERLDTAYDCANNGTLVSGAKNSEANQKVLQFYTQLNGKREQDLTLDCTGYDTITQSGGVFTDYMYMKRQLKGSMLESLNVYQYNWVWCSDYCDYGGNADQNPSNEVISGIPLTGAPITWTFYGSRMTAPAVVYQHYTWVVFYRKLNLNGKGASLEASQ